VKVFLLPLDHTQSFFYAEDTEDEAATPSNRLGWCGWCERMIRRIRSTFKHPKGRLARKMKQGWDWLQRRMHPDEPLLAALRTAPTITVYHRSSLPEQEARALWCAYLRRRLRRHVPWLVFDALLSPLALLLTPLPGPNVIGYWFAYRAVRHLLILLGIRRALSGRVETRFRPVAALDAIEGCADKQWRDRAATQYKLKGLHDFVERLAPEPATAAARDATGGMKRPCDC
jgi:hypothetical protein